MPFRIRFRLPRKAVLALGVLATLAMGVFAIVPGGAPARAATAAPAQQPCDIYQAGGAPCVGAYSTIRALYAAYDGPLYQVQRASDAATLDVSPLQAGGIANAAPQRTFCAGTTCTITEVYDQSPQHNNLTIEGPGAQHGQDVGAKAGALPVTVDGQTVYGIKVTAGTGYRDNAATGTAENGQPEGMYMVTSSNNVNNGCCFDFGNTERTNTDTGNGHMDAVNYSTRCVRFSPCYGSGPWVEADLENGLFQSDMGYSKNTANTGLNLPFVTALLKTNGQNYFAEKVGNAESGGLTTNYAGELPPGTTNGGGYTPLHQEGGIVLGTGGDNSATGTGEFFEGVITAGMPSDAADNAVQANIAAAGYGVTATATSTTLASSANPSTVGQQVTYTATVSPVPDGGTVAFSDGGTAIAGCGSAPVGSDGTATCQATYASPGEHPVTAAYSGDAGYAASTTGTALDQKVGYQISLQYDPTQANNSGSAVPVKFELLDAAGANVSAAGITVTVAGLTPSPAPGTAPAGTIPFEGNQYHLNVKTTGYPAGTYTLSFTASGDPVVHTVQFTVS